MHAKRASAIRSFAKALGSFPVREIMANAMRNTSIPTKSGIVGAAKNIGSSTADFIGRPTNIAKSYYEGFRHPVKSLQTFGKETWPSMGKAEKALFVAGTASPALGYTDENSDKSKVTRDLVASNVASLPTLTKGWTAGGGLIGNIAVPVVAGGMLMKGMDMAFKKKQPVKDVSAKSIDDVTQKVAEKLEDKATTIDWARWASSGKVSRGIPARSVPQLDKLKDFVVKTS